MSTESKATMSFSDGTPAVDFPILKGSVGPEVIDIRKLYGQTGKFTYDPGFLSTASCQSTITYIDGDKGELLYRGYPIDQLAVNCDFLEVCYLLYYGELPNPSQKAEFQELVMHHTMVHEQMQFFLRGFRRDAHPMAVLTGLIGAMSAFYHDSMDINSAEQQDISAIRLIAKMPTLVAMSFKYSIGQPFIYPQNDLSYTGNFMRMMFATPCEQYKLTMCWCGRWIASSRCTPITNRTPQPQRCACVALRVPARLQRLPLASPVSGAPRMVVPMRPA